MKSERLRFWTWAGLAVVTGLLLRLWMVNHIPRIAGDSLVYGDIAKNWLLHGVYGFTQEGAPPRPTLIRLPGYPLVLAACFRLFGLGNFKAVLVLQVFTDLLTCGLVSATARRLFGRPAALPVLWLAALCPFTANYAAAALAETPVLTCLALAFFAMTRWQDEGFGFNRWLWLLAAALSYGILLRPENGLVAAAVFPAMLWMILKAHSKALESRHLDRREAVISHSEAERSEGEEPPYFLFRSIRPVLLAAAFVLLPLLPWTIRNWRTFHVFQPLAPRSATDPGESAPTGFNAWYRTWAIDFASTEDVYWNYESDVIPLSSLPTRAYVPGCLLHPDSSEAASMRERTNAVLNDYNQTTNATPAIEGRFADLANERTRAAPLCVHLLLPIARVLDMLIRPRTEDMEIPLEWWHWRQHPDATAFAGAYALLNFGFLAAGISGFIVWGRRKWLRRTPIAFAMLASILLRCALLLTLDNAEPRYTLEFFPILFIAAGALFAPPRP